MHIFPAEIVNNIVLEDRWTLTLGQLEALAQTLMGRSADKTWIRKDNSVTIGKRFLAENCKHLERVVPDIGVRASKILKPGDSISILRASAYWHLRYQDIHPLYDGNGRTGRLIMAIQCETACRFGRVEILSSLHELENEYRWVSVPEDRQQSFELLLDILGRITGTILPADAYQLPLPLEPLVTISKTR